MASPHPEESEEWLADKIDSWIETYKKSMLIPVILSIVRSHQPAGITTVAEAVARSSRWHVTERGLYRTIKRLQDSGLIVSTAVDAPRTGAKRKDLSLTLLGQRYLEGITSNLVDPR